MLLHLLPARLFRHLNHDYINGLTVHYKYFSNLLCNFLETISTFHLLLLPGNVILDWIIRGSVVLQERKRFDAVQSL
jgi:ABC-type long-subunit fatty acid transport system fused permease/ATPase subunit